MVPPPLPPSLSPTLFPLPRSLSNEACSLCRWCPLAVHNGAVPTAEAQVLVALRGGKGGRGGGSLAVHNGAIASAEAQLLVALRGGRGGMDHEGNKECLCSDKSMWILSLIPRLRDVYLRFISGKCAARIHAAAAAL